LSTTEWGNRKTSLKWSSQRLKSLFHLWIMLGGCAFSMVKSLRLAWLKRIFNGNDGTWKRYWEHQLKPVGGLFFINCNYNVNDYTISSQFYRELLLWWAQFCGTFASESNWQRIIWNKRLQVAYTHVHKVTSRIK